MFVVAYFCDVRVTVRTLVYALRCFVLNFKEFSVQLQNHTRFAI